MKDFLKKGPQGLCNLIILIVLAAATAITIYINSTIGVIVSVMLVAYLVISYFRNINNLNTIRIAAIIGWISLAIAAAWKMYQLTLVATIIIIPIFVLFYNKKRRFTKFLTDVVSAISLMIVSINLVAMPINGYNIPITYLVYISIISLAQVIIESDGYEKDITEPGIAFIVSIFLWIVKGFTENPIISGIIIGGIIAIGAIFFLISMIKKQNEKRKRIAYEKAYKEEQAAYEEEKRIAAEKKAERLYEEAKFFRIFSRDVYKCFDWDYWFQHYKSLTPNSDVADIKPKLWKEDSQKIIFAPSVLDYYFNTMPKTSIKYWKDLVLKSIPTTKIGGQKLKDALLEKYSNIE